MTLGYDVKSGEVTDSSGVIYNINTGEISVVIDGNVSNGGGSGGSSSKYGLSMDNILGNVDENGVLQAPAKGSLNFTGVEKLGEKALYFSFFRNNNIVNVTFPDLTEIAGDYAIGNFCGYSTSISTVSFPKLKTISGDVAFYQAFSSSSIEHLDLSSLETTGAGLNIFNEAFYNCTNLKTVDLSSLIEFYIFGNANKLFQGCSSLTSVDLSSLQRLFNNQLDYAFYNCSSLPKISFPSLTSVTTKSFANTFSGCTALTEIHFRADMQANIEGLNGYADKWGATNATIYFDL